MRPSRASMLACVTVSPVEGEPRAALTASENGRHLYPSRRRWPLTACGDLRRWCVSAPCGWWIGVAPSTSRIGRPPIRWPQPGRLDRNACSLACAGRGEWRIHLRPSTLCFDTGDTAHLVELKSDSEERQEAAIRTENRMAEAPGSRTEAARPAPRQFRPNQVEFRPVPCFRAT